MNWRNPKEELPKDGHTVWVMLEPHKDRGSLQNSAMSIEIVCGEFNKASGLVENYDELGLGAIHWALSGDDEGRGTAIAWLPVSEMWYPRWLP